MFVTTDAVEPLWNSREAAEFLNVSQATLSRWRSQQEGPPFVRVGGVARYNPPTVRAWVLECEADHG
nr:helix-turn-helix domain-containing protein [Microbacterium azadirachtae]